MTEEEPLNVQVARALGWVHDPYQLESIWKCDPSAPPGLGYCTLPDFANDPAWVVRIIEKNRLRLDPDECDGSWFVGRVSKYDEYDSEAFGKTPGEAVCRWILRACVVGVEVKQ